MAAIQSGVELSFVLQSRILIMAFLAKPQISVSKFRKVRMMVVPATGCALWYSSFHYSLLPGLKNQAIFFMCSCIFCQQKSVSGLHDRVCPSRIFPLPAAGALKVNRCTLLFPQTPACLGQYICIAVCSAQIRNHTFIVPLNITYIELRYLSCVQRYCEVLPRSQLCQVGIGNQSEFLSNFAARLVNSLLRTCKGTRACNMYHTIYSISQARAHWKFFFLRN